MLFILLAFECEICDHLRNVREVPHESGFKAIVLPDDWRINSMPFQQDSDPCARCHNNCFWNLHIKERENVKTIYAPRKLDSI
jgi:hypothetical protein